MQNNPSRETWGDSGFKLALIFHEMEPKKSEVVSQRVSPAGTDGTETVVYSKEIGDMASQPQLSAFPEGGLQAWLTLLGAWLVQFCTFGYINSFGVYNDFYVREYLNNKTSSDIGWIGGVQLLAVLSAGVITGKLFDKGYFHHLMIGGTLLFGFSLFMLSLSHEHQYYQVFLSHGIGAGIASGLVYIPSLGIVSHYFQRRRALAMGIVASGSSLGAVIHPIMLNKLFNGSTGFHNGVRASAGFTLGLLIIANLVMRPRLPPRNTGPVPIGDFARDFPYVFSVIGGCLVLLSIFYPVFFLQLDAVVHGVDPNLSFYLLSILNAASIVGRIFPNFLVPYLGIYNVIIVVGVAMAVLVLSLIAVTDVGGFIAFAILFGFFSGSAISLLPPMLASLAKDVNEIGARLGICFAFAGLAGLFGIPIAGALLSNKFTWWRPSVFSGVVITGGTLFFVVARFFVAKRKDGGWKI